MSRHRNASVTWMAALLVAALLTAATISSPQPPPRPETDASAAGRLQDQVAELVEFATATVRDHFTKWTEAQIAQYVDALRQTILSTAKEPLTPDQLVAFRASLVDMVAPESDYRVSERQLRGRAVYLTWYVRSFLERKPLSPDDKGVVDEQIARLLAVAQEELEAHAVPVIGQAGVKQLVAGIGRRVGEVRGSVLIPSFKHPASEEALSAAEEQLRNYIAGAAQRLGRAGTPTPHALAFVQMYCVDAIAGAGMPRMPADLAGQLPRLDPQAVERARSEMEREGEEWKQQYKATVLKGATRDELEARERVLFLIHEMVLLQEAAQGRYDVGP